MSFVPIFRGTFETPGRSYSGVPRSLKGQAKGKLSPSGCSYPYFTQEDQNLCDGLIDMQHEDGAFHVLPSSPVFPSPPSSAMSWVAGGGKKVHCGKPNAA